MQHVVSFSIPESSREPFHGTERIMSQEYVDPFEMTYEESIPSLDPESSLSSGSGRWECEERDVPLLQSSPIWIRPRLHSVRQPRQFVVEIPSIVGHGDFPRAERRNRANSLPIIYTNQEGPLIPAQSNEELENNQLTNSKWSDIAITIFLVGFIFVLVYLLVKMKIN